MNTIILSLGGSVIAPDRIDVKFLRNFKKTIVKLIKRNTRFVIICGGGKIARSYQESLEKVIGNNQESLDWVGISATHMNAFLLRCIFFGHSDENIVHNPNEKIKSDKKIIMAGGWKPGFSTDYDAVLLAKNLKINTIINMSNVKYVYDRDPKRYSNAVKIKGISWKDFRKLTGNKWKAGLNMPFDPIAAKKAEKLGLSVIIVGNSLRNFENLVNGKNFEGTVIH